jgi:DNA-binding NarL/FixJ family response regulator
VEYINVFLVDDQLLFAESLKNILEMRTKDIKVIDVAHNGNEAIDKISKLEISPDIILMDVRMPVMSGVESIKSLRELKPDIKIMMLTTFDDDEYIQEALKYGAVGYLLKTIPPADLIASIRAIKAGNVQISPEIAKKLVHSFGRNKKPPYENNEEPYWYKYLSLREKEILQLLLEGYTNKEISRKLCIVEQTIKNHLTVIYSKMDVHSRAKAIKNLHDANITNVFKPPFNM